MGFLQKSPYALCYATRSIIFKVAFIKAKNIDITYILYTMSLTNFKIQGIKNEKK